MIFRILIILILLFSTNYASAQARRINPANSKRTAQTAIVSPADLYDTANDYAKKRFIEFAEKKVPYSEQLRDNTLREQKQLAARLAAQLAARSLKDTDFYYLGMLQMLADNRDVAIEAFRSFLSNPDVDNEKAQTARSFVVVIAAGKKSFDEAETTLKDYLTRENGKIAERVIMQSKLSENYLEVKNYNRAAYHAESALAAAKPLLSDAAVNKRIVENVFDLALTMFEICQATNADDKAESVLKELQENGIFVQSPRLYTTATDKLITFLIDENRKTEATKVFDDAFVSLKQFKENSSRLQVSRFLQKRKQQYKLLGENAPEITVDRWIDKNPTTIAGLRGKVILLDFWATWCGPCLTTFPDLIEINETYTPKGLQIIGLTRYYGESDGVRLNNDSEIAFLKKFKLEQNLDYSFAVAKTSVNHDKYLAEGLPTTVLIDKKGVVRFIKTGAGSTKELEQMIDKLLTERD
ncbi:MAG: TlpA family protein disulfide reductase [Pyrinomonadaceae bacterium]|nr:TlpA family protein disulfide reductase [Pyrinomonadaceae bacterium]